MAIKEDTLIKSVFLLGDDWPLYCTDDGQHPDECSILGSNPQPDDLYHFTFWPVGGATPVCSAEGARKF